MKTTFLSIFAGIVAMTFAACGGVGDAPEATTGEAVALAGSSGGTFAIDTARSSVAWRAAKVSMAHDGGFRDYSGSVTVDGANVTGVDLTINTASIWSDNEKLTGHLMSPDFFNVEGHPTASFAASTFEKLDTAGATHRVTGNLTMLGVTKSVVFPAMISVGASEVAAKADFIVNRKDWNIVYAGMPDDLIDDDVRIVFDIVAAPQPVAAR